jgi:hypothetical protein
MGARRNTYPVAHKRKQAEDARRAAASQRAGERRRQRRDGEDVNGNETGEIQRG